MKDKKMAKLDFDAAINNPGMIQDLLLFTLRHGQSLGQIDQKAYQKLGDANIPLTDTGLRQARAAGHILVDIALALGLREIRVLTSTGRRSSHTASQIHDVITKKIRVDLKVDKRLDKQKFGRFDGFFTSEERKAHCPDGYADYQRQLKERSAFYARPPEGESIADVQDRVSDLIRELAANPCPTILITHGTNSICAENALLDHGDEWVLNQIDKRSNCSIYALHGNNITGYRADVICEDPLNCKPDYHLLKSSFRPSFSPARPHNVS